MPVKVVAVVPVPVPLRIVVEVTAFVVGAVAVPATAGGRFTMTADDVDPGEDGGDDDDWKVRNVIVSKLKTELYCTSVCN